MSSPPSVTKAESPLLQNTTVSFTVLTHYPDGQTAMSEPLVVEVDLAAVESPSTLPKVFALYPNYPNPFNPSTQIRLDVPVTTNARLEVFDIQGRLVRTLLSGSLSAGVHTVSWNGQDGTAHIVASGLYLCRFQSPLYTATRKMLLVK